jgi:hypothetical protein
MGTVFALGLRVYAQALATNGMPPGTNGAAPSVSVGRPSPRTPFAISIVDHPGVDLPEQGPWTISVGNIKQSTLAWPLGPGSDGELTQPIGLIVDLEKHIDPMFLFLWDLLSSETRSAVEEESMAMNKGGNIKPGPRVKALAANLNQLIQGKLIYDEQAFAKVKPYFSGDTVKLLNQPAGADVSRLNRLLLEDAFPLDIMRRPKILFDGAGQNYFFIDFAMSTVSLYGKDGKKKWTADLGPSIAKEFHMLPVFRNPGIPVANASNSGLWDVFLSPRQPGLLMVEVSGMSFYRFELTTGKARGVGF